MKDLCFCTQSNYKRMARKKNENKENPLRVTRFETLTVAEPACCSFQPLSLWSWGHRICLDICIHTPLKIPLYNLDLNVDIFLWSNTLKAKLYSIKRLPFDTKEWPTLFATRRLCFARVGESFLFALPHMAYGTQFLCFKRKTYWKLCLPDKQNNIFD